MSYKTFEEIPVWRDAVSLAAHVFALTDRPEFRYKGDIANQIQRAALSVSNNIAEGFERGSTSELISFLYYARGSAGEVRSICHVMRRVSGLANFELQITEVLNGANSVGRQLGGWLKSLKESEEAMPGQRHFTNRDRDIRECARRADVFMERIRKTAEDGIAAARAKQSGKPT
jgi:four helix bundle protein